MSKILLWIVGIIAVLGIIAYVNPHLLKGVKEEIVENYETRTSPETEIPTESKKSDNLLLTQFEDFNRNPESYLGKNLQIKGGLVTYLLYFTDNYKTNTFYGLKDDEDFVIRFYPSIERAFENNKIYTISGTIIQDTICFPTPTSCSTEIFLLED